MMKLERRQTYVRRIINQYIDQKETKGYIQKSEKNQTDAYSFLNQANHSNDTVL
jgi:hypothetical protein